MTSKPLATVAILTFNGDMYLREILEVLRKQVLDGDFEVLVLDSGSTDSTLDIVRDFPEVRLHEIPNSEFGHGKSRNLAATLARGEFIAFLTHDATPQDEHWLAEMLAPFAIDPRVMAVVGRQEPRLNAIPIIKYDIMHTFHRTGPAFGTTLVELRPSDTEPSSMSFYSDVNSATRVDFLVNKIPFRDVAYAEDQLFAQDVLEAGYIKAYAGRGAVMHSNSVSFREFGMRIHDETIGLRAIGFDIHGFSFINVWLHAIKGFVRELLLLMKDDEYSVGYRFHWLLVGFWYHVSKRSNMRSACLADLDRHDQIAARSLEASRRTPKQPSP